ncbi:transketolase C-terminal domain-containing protein [Streptomyces sp. SID8352]|uniref:transketolase family protein n=1 Tax=Streptomyces sp. SID8352 TaxID=2690338 RepID=UPI00136C6182|nr:transketolase C-terminal domain-containing protein [Streptomyces sp. SID8352]MYU21898.1 transketolase [Streptomyces sp. SID8352]
MREVPYPTVLKPYGRALVELARTREEIVCLSGDLTRQCEVDLFQDVFPQRFVHAGMAEANMMSMAGALAREGLQPWVHTFGVFATRRPYDQIVNAIAYPNLPVRIVGFMPGISTPGGPSHQAIEDVAIMRALPNMTVIDVADAVEIEQVVPQISDLPGPVYLRLKRGEIPVVFDDDHEFRVGAGQQVVAGTEIALLTSGMMLPATLQAAAELRAHGIDAGVTNLPTIKPFDRAAVLAAVQGARGAVTVENHSVIGGLGSSVAEVLAENGAGVPLRRIGLRDTFAEGSKSGPYLFEKYGLSVREIIRTAWELAGRTDPAPEARAPETESGEYAPV